MTHKIQLHITIDFNTRMAQALFVFALLAMPVGLGSETINLTTTYPSPVGIYNRIITTGGTLPGNPQRYTLLARSAGHVVIGNIDPTVVQTQQLEVSGNIHANATAGCTAQPYTIGGGWTGCAAGIPGTLAAFATYLPGVYTSAQYGSTVPPGMNTQGWMFCCPVDAP